MATSTRLNPETKGPTEVLLADIIRIAADAIICLDADQRITLYNDGAEQIFGWTRDEVLGHPLDVLLPERVRGMHRQHIQRFAESGARARRMGERQEISGLRKNGQEFPAEAAIAKVSVGDTVVYSVVLRDITEQVELHKRLQRAVQARDDTVGVVAHDLRNPVSAVKMLSKALLERAPTEEFSGDAQEQLAVIRDAALQMDRLIQDLLDVTRVETGRMGINPQPVTTVALLEGSLGTLRPLVEEAGLKLIVDLPSTLPVVNADPERVAQVLSNLVGNAIKFTREGGQVIIRASMNGDREVAISVSDNGVGIGGDQLPNIFDRYWQAQHSSLRARGAGLGLPIARGIVHAHGGRMWVESKIGEGSTFYFTLPVASSG